MKYLKPSAGFRETWQYNNNMYMVLSAIPPRVLPYNTSFTHYVKRRILDPLGMNATTYSYQAARDSGELAEGMMRQGVLNQTDDIFRRGKVRVVPPWFQSGGESDHSGSIPALISKEI